jgi:hypothetical protein
MAPMRTVLVSLLLVGCMDSTPKDLPRCTEVRSCRAAVSGPGESWVLCGPGDEMEAVCDDAESCRVSRQDNCVCRFGADGAVTALCYTPMSGTSVAYP